MFSLTTQDVQVSLNGVELLEEDIFSIVDQEKLKWTDPQDVEIMVVGETDRLPDVFGKASAHQGDVLILVHTTHKDIFGKYKQYFGRASRKFELDKEKDIVVVSTDYSELETINIDIQNNVVSESLTNVIGVIPG